MGAHEWVDVAGYIFAGTTGILSTFLGYRLIRHDQERKAVEEKLQEHGERLSAVEAITSIISQHFRPK